MTKTPLSILTDLPSSFLLHFVTELKMYSEDCFGQHKCIY